MTHDFFIDTSKGRRVTGFRTNKEADDPVFTQGDGTLLRIFLLTPSTVSGQAFQPLPFPVNSTLRVGIGRIEARPQSGYFRLQYGTDTTGNLRFDSTAKMVGDALNALPSIIALGGGSVQMVGTGAFSFYWNLVGVRDAIAVDASRLLPTSQAILNTVRSGTDTVTHVQSIRLKQVPVALQPEWADLPTAQVNVTSIIEGSVSTNALQRITLLNETYGGSFVLSFSGQCTTPIPFNASAIELQSKLEVLSTIGAGNISVSNVEPFTFDIQFCGALQNTAQALIVANAVALLALPGKSANLRLDTVGVEEMLSGKTSEKATLEIEVTTLEGTRHTYLQIPCTLLNDMLDGQPYSPIPMTVFYTKEQIDALLEANVSANTEELSATTEEIFADVSAGAISAGTALPIGTTFQQFLTQLLTTSFDPTFVAPSLSLSSSIGLSVEAGTTGLTLSASYNRGAINGLLQGGVWNPALKQNDRAGAPTSVTINGEDNGTSLLRAFPLVVITDDANTFNASLAHAEGVQPLDSKGTAYNSPLPAGTLTASVTVNGRRRAFWGVNSLAVDSAAIRSLGNSLLNPLSGTQFTINIPSGAASVVFAYKASLGAVNSVKYVEGLNAEVKGIFTLTTVPVNDAAGASPVLYNVYRYQPGAAFGANATYNVTI